MKVEEAFEIVEAAYTGKRMPHAYLVVGSPRGEGLDLAEKIAALLLCKAADVKHPCLKCDDCLNVKEHKHADTMWVEPESKSRIISVVDAREKLIDWGGKSSYLGGWKIGVVLFADRLNPNSGNAFLKMLEEPPEETLFLLVTSSPDSLLPTVISRCQRLDLNVGRTPPAEPWRSEVGKIMAGHSNSSALRVLSTSGRMVSLFDDIKKESEKSAKERLKQILEMDMQVDDDTYKAWISAGAKEIRAAVFASIRDWYRDVMVLSSTGGETGGIPLFFPEYKDATTAAAERTNPQRAVQNITFVDNMERQMEVRNMREDLVFPYWFTWLR